MYPALWKWLKKARRFKSIKRVFVSSLDNLEIRLILTQLRSSELLTFDDGTLSISTLGHNYFYKQKAKTPWLLRCLIGLKDPLTLAQRVCKHYTIYKLPNTSSAPLEYIPLFPQQESNQAKQEASQTIHLLLGQPIYEFLPTGMSNNINITNKVLTQYPIDYYFPHPREFYHIQGVKYIDTQLIFEDYIIQELQKNPNTCYHIYTFCSSVVFNLPPDPQLQFTALYPPDVEERYGDIYRLIRQLGITIVQI